MKALRFAKGLIENNSNEALREEIVIELQKHLNGNGDVHHFSPLIWAIEKDNPSYPAWYSTGIVASNIEDLKILSEQEIIHFIENILKGENNKV